MNPKDRTERRPQTATGMVADVYTADQRKSESKRPEAESAMGTAVRNLMAWFALHYGNDRVAA